MLAELTEDQATGEVAVIYAEIRHLCAVPYVSSLQRHLATRPGWLEWGWHAVRPVFASGVAQTAAWNALDSASVQPLPSVPVSTQRLWGLSAQDCIEIRSIGDLFVRVSPTNLMLSAMLRRVLAGDQPSAVAPDDPQPWTPPASIPPPPALVPVEDLDPDTRASLNHFATVVAGQPFIPGLYRMLGEWPTFLGYLATVLAPRFKDADTLAACRQVQQLIDGAAAQVFAQLPPIDTNKWPMPPQHEHPEVLDAMDRYRETSPQMIVFGGLIRDCLLEE